MTKKVKMNYYKLLLPVAAALIAACAALLLITKFGIRYGLMTSVPVESIAVSELEGSCAQAQITQLEGTFARAGSVTQEEADETGAEIDIKRRYCTLKLSDGKYIGVQISDKKQLQAIEDFGNAISELGYDEAKAMDFGLMRGTVNEMPDELYELFLNWAESYAEEDGGSAVPEENVYKLILDVDYYGPFSQGKTIAITVIAIVLFVLAIAMLALGVFGVFDKPIRLEVKRLGKAKLEEEFRESKAFAGKLYIGKEHIWCLGRYSSDILLTGDVIWIYARSRRLEGGKLTWYLVIKTIYKKEYKAHLGDAAKVQEAENLLKELVSPICTGFDKEKQKQYDKDIAVFRSRVKNGTL